MESAIVGDKGSTTLGKNGNTKLENNYLCRCQDYSMIDGLYDNTRIAKGGTPLPHPLPRVRKHERIQHHINNGSVSCYFYDAAGERTVKLTSETEMVHVNGKKVGGNDAVTKFTAYVSPYFVVSNGGAYTKHIYAANQRIASKLGNIDGFGADPRRVEMAGGKKYSDNQSGTIKARFEALNIDYSDGNGKKDDEEYEPTMDSEAEEKLIFFYHPDHLGSTSYVTDADGNIAQHVEYIPYGEVFVEERNSQFSTNFLFNAKELDNETGLYYYGARYLDPTGAMWLSVDPMWEKNIDANPYNYCHGNPVVLVDPDGMDDYGLDDGGKIYFIKETDQKNTDKVYSDYKKRSGRHSENFVEIPSGILKKNENGEFSDDANKYGKGYRYNFETNTEKAKEFFEFVAENSHVEWSMTVELSNSEEELSNVFTTRRNREEVVGANYAYSIARKLILHVHSHPDLMPQQDDADDNNRVPGKDDLNTRDQIQSLNLKFVKDQNEYIKRHGGGQKEYLIPNSEFIQ